MISKAHLSSIKVPALWYDAPRDADATAPPPGTFILPESALIVDFIASVYPDLQCTSYPGPRLTSADLII